MSQDEVNFFAEIAEPLSDGTWVNSKIARIVDIIRDYDPNLEVRWLPRDQRSEGNDVFQIVEHCKDGVDRVAFSIKDEASFDERVLNRIFEADLARSNNGPVTLEQKIQIDKTTREMLTAKKWEEKQEEKKEIAYSILKSPLNAYTHNGIRYDLPTEDQPKKVIVHQATIRRAKKSKFKEN